MKTEIFSVRSLVKKFAGFTAVDRIDFFIRRGEILGFLGPNGAGKTTTIKMLLGLMTPTSGEILIENRPLRKNRELIKKMVGYMSQRSSLYPLLTSLENIEFFGGIAGLSPGEIRNSKEMFRSQVPTQILKLKVGDIPPGIRQKVALFISLLKNPDIILLDEPTSGVDPAARREFWLEIYRLKTIGKTILVTTHHLDEAEFADRILIIHQGRIIRQGEPRALMTADQVSSMESLFEKSIRENEI